MNARDLAGEIYLELTGPGYAADALEIWHTNKGCAAVNEHDQMAFLLAHMAARAIDAVLARRQHEAARRQREAARTGPWDAPRVDLQYGRMQDALERIVSWSEAYPLDIFPKPDLEKARELLEAGGITLDAVSAHCMRHVIDGVGKIAREAARTGPWDGIAGTNPGDTPAKTGGAP